MLFCHTDAAIVGRSTAAMIATNGQTITGATVDAEADQRANRRSLAGCRPFAERLTLAA